MAKIKLDADKHRVLVKEVLEARTYAGVLVDVEYECIDTKITKRRKGVTTEKVKRCYVLRVSEEDFVQFINELIDGGRLAIKTAADFRILRLEVFGKNTVAAHTSNSGGFITFTIKDFLSAYKFYSS